MALFNVIVTLFTVALVFIVLCFIHLRFSRLTRYTTVLSDTPTSFIEAFTPPPPAAAVASVVDASGDGAGGVDDRHLDFFDGLGLEETLELQTPPPPPLLCTPRRSSRLTK